MSERLTRIRSMLTFALAIFYLANLFIRSDLINDAVVILMVIVILLSLPVVSGSARTIGYASIGLSAVLFLVYHAPLQVWKEALEANLYLVVLFALVPLLRIPIRRGGYFEPLQQFFCRYVNTNSRFYMLVSFISAFVGILVNLAVVPLAHEISKASPISSNKKLLSSALSRGFTTCTIWSPTTASIALIMQLTGAEWFHFFPFGLMCGIIAGLVGYTLTMHEEKKGEAAPFPAEKPTGTIDLRKVMELTGFGAVLIGAIAFISFISGMQTINIVSLAALIFPLIWMILIGRLPVFLNEFKDDYFKQGLPNVKNEIFLFVGAGLFASSITYSHLGDYIPQFLSWLTGSNALWFMVIVIFGNLILSALGVHPIITITVIGGTVQAGAYGLSPVNMAMVLAICWAMGISISPSAANVVAISGLAGESPLQVGPRWNGWYVIFSSIVLIFLMTILRWVGLI